MEELETQAVETEQPQATESSPAEASEQPNAQEPLDLDSVQKFRFAGKEWTPKDFQGAYMMQADYTRKTQQLAEERKYYDNLSADLESVKRDPRLAENFKSIYPKKFHNYLGYVANASQPAQRSPQESQNPGIPSDLEDRFKRMESHYQTQTQQAAEAQVEASCQKFGEKYSTVKGPYEALALGMLSNRLDQIKQDDPNGKLSDSDWDSAYKQVHEQNQKMAKDIYAKQVANQKNINNKAKDVASGGGTPGQAPKTARTIKAASDLARQDPNFQ